jgi:hypothetical protein
MLLFRGPSKFDPSATIAAVLTGYQRPSKNAKTGPMAQLYIIRTDVHPWEAQQSGQDAAASMETRAIPAEYRNGQLRQPLGSARRHRTRMADVHGDE